MSVSEEDENREGDEAYGIVQEFVVARASQLTPIPDDVPLSMAAPILCAGLTSKFISYDHQEVYLTRSVQSFA